MEDYIKDGFTLIKNADLRFLSDFIILNKALDDETWNILNHILTIP